MSSLIEQAAERLAKIRAAGIDVPAEDSPAVDALAADARPSVLPVEIGRAHV
jgi:hypothetical protein